MSVIVDTHCPNCKKDHPTAIPYDDLKVALGRVHQDKPDREVPQAPDLDALIEKKLKDREPKEPEKPNSDEPKLLNYVPGYRCGPDCQKLHRNKGYKTRPKGKCNNCDQLSNVEKGPCPWCEDGEIEKIDEEELDSLGIRKPEVHEHGDE